MMNTSRRKESFRYAFTEEIDSPFMITEINGNKFESKYAVAKLVDLSQNGCRIESFLDLNAADNKISIAVKFNLMDQNIELTGHVSWQRSTTYCHYYGIKFVQSNPGDNAFILDYLKSYTKNRSQSIAT
jgi:hypothetical protein